jgi:tRNA1(Val) A37 N6-methylase TrmN6
MAFAPEDLRLDHFLDGRVAAWQPVRGYRSATDAVFLAAAVPSRTGDRVLDLGCGAGVAGLCLAARTPGVQVTGLEIQPEYADLARHNGLRAITGDLAAPPAELRAEIFDHVMANPPYFDPAATGAADGGRDRAQREATPLPTWIDAGLRRLAPGGTITLIHRAERLPDILAALHGRAGSVRALPLFPRAGRPAGRVIVQARKGARGAFSLLSGLVIHEGATHDGDRDSFTTEANAILRGVNPLMLAAR